MSRASTDNLDTTWILVDCGKKRFAINSKYISGIDDLKQDKCIGASTKFNVRRGLYNILGMSIMVLDSRKIVDEPMITSLKMEMSNKIHSMKYELLKWVDDAEWSIMSKSSVETDYKKFEIYNWLLDESGIKDVDNIKKKLLIAYKEMFIIFENALEVKKDYNKGIAEALKIHDELKKHIDKNIIKQLNKIITIYNGSISESCIVLKHKDFKYGLAVDDIYAITERVSIKSYYSEYKPIAGKLIYGDKEYYIFNVNYLSNLAARFDAIPVEDE